MSVLSNILFPCAVSLLIDDKLGAIKVKEISIDYSECLAQAPVYPAEAPIPGNVQPTFKTKNSVATHQPTWSRFFTQSATPPVNRNVCRLRFYIPEDIGPPIYMYYRLTNFYQNHRKYVQSMDFIQLSGKFVSNQTINSGQCTPLTSDPTTGKAYYPCGLIANSQFNDSIQSPYLLNEDSFAMYNMTNKGISWGSDKKLIKKTSYQNDQVLPPPNWHERYPNNYTDEQPIPNLNEDEDFLVWMRTAGLPDFSKLARRNDTTTMQTGYYSLDIEDRKFPRSSSFGS